MVAVLTTRIVNPLAFMVVRRRIYDILVAELQNQQDLAVLASQDPTPYEITVYEEKYNPWTIGQFPLVNVWYDTGSIDMKSSSPTGDQQGEHYYNCDLYYHVPSEVVEGETIYGDSESQKAAQLGGSLIFQILMADLNTRLQFPSRGAHPISGKIIPIAFLSHRQVTELIAFKPTFGEHFVENVVAFRVRLETVHLELIPHIVGLPLEGIDATISRQDTTTDTDIGISINV